MQRGPGMQARGTSAAETLHRAPAASISSSSADAMVSGTLQRNPSDAALSAQVAVLLLADMAPGSVLWGWSRQVRGPRALRPGPGLRFARVLGSGHEGRFGLRPSTTLQGLFLLFDEVTAAEVFLATSTVAAAYRAHAREWCSATLWDFFHHRLTSADDRLKDHQYVVYLMLERLGL